MVLMVLIHLNVAEAKLLIERMDKKLDMIKDSLSAPTESEFRISCYVEANGGVERCVRQDDILRELILLSEGPDAVSTIFLRI